MDLRDWQPRVSFFWNHLSDSQLALYDWFYDLDDFLHQCNQSI